MDAGRPDGLFELHGARRAFYRIPVQDVAAHQRAKGKLDEIDKEFGKQLGRSYGGQIEEYRTEDAEFVIVTMGCSTGTAKVVVDRKRDEGIKVGLVKIRMSGRAPQSA